MDAVRWLTHVDHSHRLPSTGMAAPPVSGQLCSHTCVANLIMKSLDWAALCILHTEHHGPPLGGCSSSVRLRCDCTFAVIAATEVAHVQDCTSINKPTLVP